jgi:ADP-ribosylglycohydrolase
MVNCGATMYMAPVGIVNAGAPEAAYKEAIDIAGAHQSSYGREAAGVFAAAVAAAITPQTKVDEILEIAVDLAHDGTKSAIQTILKTAETISDWRAGLQELRRSIAPFDSMAEAYREPGPDARKPSRLRAIEELPIALAILKITRGNFKEGVLGAINYGRDSDSIATMLGAISGAMNGRNSIPEDWVETVERESKRDFLALGKTMAAIARNIAEKDAARESRVALAREKIYSNPPLYRAK